MLVLASCGYWGYHVSDAHRLSLFRAHKSEYETLVNMLWRDRALAFVNVGLTDPQDPVTIGISPQRISDYRRLMSNVRCGSISWSGGSALFASDTAQAADILYFPTRSAKEAGWLPDRPPRQARRIEGDWYLSSPNFLL
jgi:hypothetical protein